jgi:hypothetical protein
MCVLSTDNISKMGLDSLGSPLQKMDGTETAFLSLEKSKTGGGAHICKYM